MVRINDHFLKLKAGYLFPEISRRVAAFAAEHPDASIIKLGIGDVTEPLPPAIVAAMHTALDEMARSETFHGYGPEQGYDFLREAIVEHDYRPRDCEVSADEIFISDGSKCDCGNILDILGPGNSIAIADPVYPVYVDTNVMAGNTGPADETGRYGKITYLPATAENDFTPALPDERVDLIYLCYPNNPTGAAASREALSAWVDYARANDALILFDAAYEAYITTPGIPHSIYEVPGARQVAIEFRSFSKNAGFTGTRCGFTVVPKELTGSAQDDRRHELHALWNRRQSTKFNGVNYVVQRGAESVYQTEGQEQVQNLVNFYLENARLLREGLSAAGVEVFGGVDAPYIWLRAPGGASSWDFFDHLLSRAELVGTPGSGFGAAGEGYFRLSAFNSRANVEAAIDRFTRAI